MIRVAAIVRMPVSTMGACFGCLTDHPTPDVLRMCHRLEVRGVHARSIAAEVVEVQALWDRPVGQLPCDPVGRLPVLDSEFVEGVEPIAGRLRDMACPLPTAIVCLIGRNLRPKQIRPNMSRAEQGNGQLDRHP